MRLAALLDGNNGSLSMTLGLGDPIGATFTMAESKLILGRTIKEPSLFSRAFSSSIAPSGYIQSIFNEDAGGSAGGSSGGGDTADGSAGDSVGGPE